MEFVLEFLTPKKNKSIVDFESVDKKTPVIWLLGKTGAGKSSFVKHVTGKSDVEIGNGFSPCTNSSKSYRYPEDFPVIEFLDTRGLGEVDYDPSEDIEVINESTAEIIVFMKVTEPEQSSVLNVLKEIRKKNYKQFVTVIHTAVKSLSEEDSKKQIDFKNKKLKEILGNSLNFISVDFIDEGYNVDEVIKSIEGRIPVIQSVVDSKNHKETEKRNFDLLSNEIIAYASMASGTDLIPGVGLVSVPTVQLKMLHSIANRYGIEWNKRTYKEFFAVMGAAFTIEYGLILGLRQASKFIPVYGQTIGAATSASISFATTYSLGRTACYYFYNKSKGNEIDRSEINKIYKNSKKKEVNS